MAHFAEIDSDNKVTRVIVVSNSYGPDILQELSAQFDGTWLQTSYNTRGGKHILGGTPLRKNFASPGYIYDAQRDAFIPPQPFPSWTLDEETCWWKSPIPYPTDGKKYKWDELTLSWVEVTNS